jgi:hypothetical protein
MLQDGLSKAAAAQVNLGGLQKVEWLFVFSCAAHDLIGPRPAAHAIGESQIKS